MEEDKRVVSGTVTDAAVADDTDGAIPTETAPVAAARVSDTSAEATATDDKSATECTEDEDISARLRRAGDRIDRASTEAEIFKRRRDKESAIAERDVGKARDSEKRKLEDDEKKREAAVEERRAAMEYAESYRARVRAEKESNAARKRADDKEKARAEEKIARERQIAEGIEREREEARARGARAESLLSKIDGSISAITTAAATDKKEGTPPPVSSISPDCKPEEMPEADAVGASPAPTSEADASAFTTVADGADGDSPSESEKAAVSEGCDGVDDAASVSPDDYVIRIEDDAPKKDILYIDGATACEIAIGGAVSTAAPTTASAAGALGATASVAKPLPITETADKPTAVPPISTAEGKLVTPVEEAVPTTAVAGDLHEDYLEVVRTGGDTEAARSLEEYSSMISAVKGSDIPRAPVTLAEGTPIGDYEADRELLHHASAVPKKQYVTTQRGEDFDITPKYPDPSGKPLTPKEARRREREALAEERRALLEFEKASKRRRIAKAQKSAEERAIEEYESAEEALLVAGTPEKAPAEPISGAEKTAPVSSIESAYPDPIPSSVPSSAGADTTAKATPVFDKKALEKNKKRQQRNDLLLVEHRIYDELRRLEMDTRTGQISFAARIETGKDKRERSRKRVQLSDTKRRLTLARKYENEDNARYYQLVMLDIERARLPRRTDKNELRELRDRLMALLKSRDEMNLKLIELYSLSAGGKSGVAQGRFNAELEGKKRAFKRQLPTYKKYERAGIAPSDKQMLYPLMDERTELYGELSKINYMLKREKARGLSRRELLKDRRRVERKLDENKRAIIHHEKKAMRRAERKAEGNRAAILGWTVLGIIAVAALLAVIFWKDIQPWIMNTAFPWISEKLGQLVGWVMSLLNGSTPPAE